MSELAKKLVAEEKQNRTGRLDLGRCGLTDLEAQIPELFELTWLEELILSNRWWDGENRKWKKSSNNYETNHLNAIPSNLSELSNLTTLIIGGDDSSLWGITDISFLENLLNLNHLSICDNNIKDAQCLERLVQLTYLNISFNKIIDYKFIEKLTNLNTLILNHTKIKDYSFLGELPNLYFLSLADSEIEDISFLKSITTLESLELHLNSISDIRFLENLFNLNYLNVSSNKIYDIRFLEQLKNLNFLDISGNQIIDTSYLKRLTKLSFLDISGNQITDISLLCNLDNLKYLDIGNNYISNIRPLENLTNLNYLDISGNKVNNIRFLSKLKNLKQLNLYSTNVSNISVLKKMTNLNELTIGPNQINNLRILEKLSMLDYLAIINNRIEDISFFEKLSNLNALVLINNQITTVNVLKKLPFLEFLQLHNPIRDIPRGLLSEHNCLPNLKAWWAETEDPSQTEPNRHIKLMLIGNGNAGKSTLFYALKDGKCDIEMDSTHGVLLETWHCEEDSLVSFVTWDFGGQEIYHGTHRLFMESEAVQLIVIDPEAEKDARDNIAKPDRITGEAVRYQPLAYWIETTRENSPNSALIVVQNKKDLFPDRYMEAYLSAAKSNLEYYQVSARRGDRIPLLRAALHEKARELPDYGMPMPRSWRAARQYFLDNLQKPAEERERLISKADFFRRCKEDFGVMEMAIPSLLTLLHYNGIIYYNDNYLKDTIIADQRWALDAIYKPLDRKSDFYDSLRNDTYGKTRVKNLFRAFGAEYSDKDKWLFLHFMRSCGLCFPMKESHGSEKETEDTYYVFPEFLPGEMSDTAHLLWENKTRRLHYFRRKYEYLNYSRIQSFIVKLGQKTRMENIWRNGILIPTHEGDFLVYADYSENAVVISIEENALHKWLSEILETWGDSKRTEQWEGWETSTDEKDYQPANLKVYDRRDVPFDEQEQKDHRKTLVEQLPDIIQARPFHLVASYAKEDRKSVEALEDQLSSLCKDGKINFWWDQKRDGKDYWDTEIEEQFNDADGFVIFVSPTYMNHNKKKYIHEKEIPIMIRKKEEERIPSFCITVIPVDYGSILGQFDYFWDKTPLPKRGIKQGEFLYKFVEEVVKGKFLKPAGE